MLAIALCVGKLVSDPSECDGQRFRASITMRARASTNPPAEARASIVQSPRRQYHEPNLSKGLKVNLEEFVAGTLSQIIKGVAKAQQDLASTGALINPSAHHLNK